jgi:glycosyltransferase involved in cell wall biosynthesis
MKGLRVLMLLDNPFTNDRRVQREAGALSAAGYRVDLLCMQHPDLPEHEVRDHCNVYRILPEALKDPKKLRTYKIMAQAIINRFEFDIIHSNDQFMLHLGSWIKRLKKGKPVLIYDSHELFHAWPLNTDAPGLVIRLKSALVRALQIRREQRNGKYIDHLITVNQSLADDLGRHFRLAGSPAVVRNVPELPAKLPPNTILRSALGIPEKDKLVVFIGGNIYPGTLNLEQVIMEFGNQAGIHLAFITSNRPGKKAIESFVKQHGFTNIHFHPLIPPDDIPAWLSGADAGLVPTWNKKDLSYWYALDNKLFEYMMSEIPVLATRQPEYRRIVENYGIGICVDPEVNGAYLKGFWEMMQQKETFVQNARKAKEVLHWGQEKKALLDLYAEIKSQLNP